MNHLRGTITRLSAGRMMARNNVVAAKVGSVQPFFHKGFRAARSRPVPSRCFATKSIDEEEEKWDHSKMPKSWEPYVAEPMVPLTESTMRGIGQVIFLNSPICGSIILGSLCVGGGTTLGALALLGSATATSTAKAVGLPSDPITNGLYGYNGCLVGCAAGVFLAGQGTMGSTLGMTTFTLLGAAATPLVSAVLPKVLPKDIPPWTYAFNVVTLTSLLAFKGPPSGPESMFELFGGLPDTALPTGFGAVFLGPLKGVSQIFVVESSLSGMAILGGIGLYSPMLAAHALAGSTIGSLTGGLFLGGSAAEIAAGLWGYNSALTSMAIGTFFVHSKHTVALSAVGAAATAVVFGATKTLLASTGAPCLTLPFCFAASALYSLHEVIPSLKLASNPHSPEKNTA